MVNAISVTGLKMTAIRVNYLTGQGSARGSDKEFMRFLYIARASSAEVETQLIIAKNIGYLTADTTELEAELLAISKMLSSLINTIRKRIDS